MATPVLKRLFTVDEYQHMAEVGILTEDDRVELIEGEIVKMSPIGKLHQACTDQLNALIGGYVRQSAILRVQGPIDLDGHSQVQPDLVLLRYRNDFYRRRMPVPEDVILIIEVSDSTLKTDRALKLPLYATVDIPEMWIVNLASDMIEVYTQPKKGKYQIVRQAMRGETIDVRGVPGLTLKVSDILG